MNLMEAVANVINNAEVVPDPRMQNGTDCYLVTLDDIDNLRAATQESTELSRPLFLLVKAQVWRETLSKLNLLHRLVHDTDYTAYFRRLEQEKVNAINTAKELDKYLRDSRRLSLQEWLDSLTWEHTQQ